jgi:hypothetical protein
MDWVVDICSVGDGHAAFRYVAPYIFRVAITNNRILSCEDGKVTFVFKNPDSKDGTMKRATLTAEHFIHRLLQHVLPPRFRKVRHYGLFSPHKKHLLDKARQLFFRPSASQSNPDQHEPKPKTPLCPNCAHSHGSSGSDSTHPIHPIGESITMSYFATVKQLSLIRYGNYSHIRKVCPKSHIWSYFSPHETRFRSSPASLFFLTTIFLYKKRIQTRLLNPISPPA